MASLSLRAYLQKIENLIDRGETEEAIAHCKHILKKFPKHVDTYRLLGKSYLEMQRYQEASDVLQRVLSVVPDDFVSQIGMSIIREDSENLDEAIWHMERAFEIQPSNNAVQDELKRLYGRRDGVVPQKILLTRGALVRMYVRGEAYPQAIAEGIAALKEDPQRSDIQLLLAKSYLRTNQINEGYRICQKILESLPYSYEANQLIAEIHILTKQSEQAEPYLEHVRMLDPYAAFVNENAPTSAKVDENAIIIDELDYDELTMSLDSSDSVEKSIFVDDDFDTSSLEIPTAGDSQPIEIDEDFSWMQDMMNESESNKPAAKKSVQESRQEEETEFPFDSASDFENIQSENIFSSESSEDDDAFAALFAEMNTASDTPDTSEPEIASKQPTEDQEPMTMAEFFESTAADTGATSIDQEDSSLDDFVALFGAQTSDNQENIAAEESIAETGAEEQLFATETQTDSEVVAENENAASLFGEHNAIPEEQPAPSEHVAMAEDVAEESDDLPDWLKELDQESKDSDIEVDLQNEIDSLFTNGDLTSSTGEQPTDQSSEGQLDDEEEFAAKFLEELENEPQHPRKTRMFSMTADLSRGDSGPLPPLSEDAAPAEKASEEEIPDWLKQLEEQTNEFSDQDESLPVTELQEEVENASASNIDSMSEEEEDLLREQYKAAQQTTETTQMLSEDEDDDGFAWLESLAAKQSTDEESTPLDESENVSATMEEGSPLEKDEIQAVSTSIDAMSEEEEDRLREQFKSSEKASKATETSPDEDDDSFAWLESLAAKQEAIDESAQPEEISAAPIDEEIVEETMPEPVQQKSATSIDSMTEEEEERLREQFKSAQQSSKATQMVSDEEDDSFAWLESLAAKQGASADTLTTSEEERDIETPEWLQAMTDSEEPVIATPEHTAILNGLNEDSEKITEEAPVTISELEKVEIKEEIETKSNIEEPVWVDEFGVPEEEAIDEAQIPSSDSSEASSSEPEEEVTQPEVPIAEQSIEEQPIEEAPAQKTIEAPQTPDDIPDWLKDLEDQTSIYALTDKDDIGQSIEGLEDVEIPGWITDVNETQQVDLEDEYDNESDDIPQVHAEYISNEDIEEDQSAEAFKAIGLDINELENKLEQDQIVDHVDGEKVVTDSSDNKDAEPAQEAGIPQEEIPAPVNEVASPISETESTQTEEELVFDIPSDFVDEILQETEPTGPDLQGNESDAQQFSEIQKKLLENNIPAALEKADQLIEKEIYLENIIEELNKAIVDHPLDPSIFVRLGDAYIRNNEIQKALDMYQEAETLLQK